MLNSNNIACVQFLMNLVTKSPYRWNNKQNIEIMAPFYALNRPSHFERLLSGPFHNCACVNFHSYAKFIFTLAIYCVEMRSIWTPKAISPNRRIHLFLPKQAAARPIRNFKIHASSFQKTDIAIVICILYTSIVYPFARFEKSPIPIRVSPPSPSKSNCALENHWGSIFGWTMCNRYPQCLLV